MSEALEILRKIDEVTLSGSDDADRLNQLDEIYKLTVKRAECDIRWYQVRKTRYRKLSRAIRLLTFTLLFVGTLTPLGLLGEQVFGMASEKFGYIILAAAGLLYSCDKTFLLSKGWMRYLATEMEIKELILAYRYDWKIIRIELERITSADKKAVAEIAALKSFKAFILAVHELVGKETQTWAEDFKTAVAAMGKRLKAKEEQFEKKIADTERQERAGALLVSVRADNMQSNEIKVSVDSKIEEIIPAHEESCAFIGLEPGLHKVEASMKIQGKRVIIATDIVKIPPGEKISLKMQAKATTGDLKSSKQA